jgi:hypothetical protein
MKAPQHEHEYCVYPIFAWPSFAWPSFAWQGCSQGVMLILVHRSPHEAGIASSAERDDDPFITAQRQGTMGRLIVTVKPG